MPAYLIAEHIVTDAAKFEEYRTKVGPMMAKHGARYLTKAGATSTQSGRMNRWTTSHQHRKCSCPHSLRGRLRYVDRLRRPRWGHGQIFTNIPPGPLDGGRSELIV